MQTAIPTQKEISELNEQREKVKLALLEKEAEKLWQSGQFFTLGISTPKPERAQLDLDIARLKVHLQQTKMEVAKMKKIAQEIKATSLITSLISVLESNGLTHEVDEVQRKAIAEIDRVGLGGIYRN
jgi:hypothetical protein